MCIFCICSHCVSFVLLIIDFIVSLHVRLIRVLLKINQSITLRSTGFADPQIPPTSARKCASVSITVRHNSSSDCVPFHGHIKTADRQTIEWLVHWLLIGGLLHLVQRGGARAGCGPAQFPPRCNKCNSSPINGQCSNFILFDVAYNCLCSLKI